MIRDFLIVVLVLGVAAVARAQSPAVKWECPRVSVTCSTDLIGPERTAIFSGSISGADPNTNYQFEWALTGAKILRGQGTPTLTIGEIGDDVVKTALVITGLPSECPNSASASFLSPIEPPAPRKIAEFVSTTRRRERRILNRYVQELIRKPTVQGFIFVYQSPGENGVSLTRHLDQIRKYLEVPLGMPAGRIEVAGGGYRKASEVELWIIWQGSVRPLPTPTIDASAVEPKR
jgi:hypothetical protein